MENLNLDMSSGQTDLNIGSDELKGKYLTFWTDSQLFGVPIADVVQIVKVQEITEIPEFPSYAKGIINLRGNIIPVVDVRLRFGKEEIPYTDHTCIIITNISSMNSANNSLMGFIVDGVEEVTDIPDEEISAPPRMNADLTNAFLTGVGKHDKKVVLLIDTMKILGDEQFSMLQDIQ